MYWLLGSRTVGKNNWPYSTTSSPPPPFPHCDPFNAFNDSFARFTEPHEWKAERFSLHLLLYFNQTSVDNR